MLGNRDTATFSRLYDKVKHLRHCLFYTDNWKAFSEVLPAKRHIIGKSHTYSIEQDNSNTRHHLGRFTRRTKIVSKSVNMVDTTLKLWTAINTPSVFEYFQKVALSIYKVITNEYLNAKKIINKITNASKVAVNVSFSCV